MIPRHNLALALAVLSLQSLGSTEAARPVSDEEEARRQQRRLDYAAREQHAMAMRERRRAHATGTSLLDKARRAKGRL